MILSDYQLIQRLMQIEHRLTTDVPGVDVAALPAVSVEAPHDGRREQQQVRRDAFVSAIEHTTQRE